MESKEGKMHWRSLAALAVLLAHGTVTVNAQQMMRFSCSKLTIERLDPLVSPGMEQSPHMHQVGGGNSFRANMPPVDYDPVKESTCTSCTFAEDFSNYWTANLFFKARNGSLKRVPQLVNMGLKADGGLTVYYIPPYDGKTNVTAFKPVGFFDFITYWWLPAYFVPVSIRCPYDKLVHQER